MLVYGVGRCGAFGDNLLSCSVRARDQGVGVISIMRRRPGTLALAMAKCRMVALARLSRLGAACLIALAAITTGNVSLAQPPEITLTPAASKYAGEIQIALNKSQILRSQTKIASVMIGNPKIADVMPLTDHTVYVLGKALGSTNLVIYGPNKVLVAVADVVVSNDIEGLKRQLHDLLPSEKIEIRGAGDAVVLSGTVSDADKLSRAVKVAQQYSAKVTNLLTVKGSQQVLLHVRFAEVQRNAAKELGIDTQLLIPGSTFFNAATGGAATPLIGAANASTTTLSPQPVVSALSGAAFADTFGTISFARLSGPVQLANILNALEQKGLVKTLAEPNLIALSGDTANFLAGGEFPVPVAQSGSVSAGGGTGVSGTSAITVDFKPFGVSLAFTPTVLSDGLINLVVAPEVSAIDRSTSTTVNGITVPGLTTRRAKTTVELRDGQSFAIAGLLQNDFADTIRKFPILGDIPILGPLFRSTNFQNNETELVIIVTPYRVKPVRPDQLLLPTDHLVLPSDEDLFLLGHTEGRRRASALQGAKSVGGAAEAGGVEGQYGHIVK